MTTTNLPRCNCLRLSETLDTQIYFTIHTSIDWLYNTIWYYPDKNPVNARTVLDSLQLQAETEEEIIWKEAYVIVPPLEKNR